MSTPLPVLQTVRLTLSQLQLKDAEDVFKYASNPNVAKFTSWPPHLTVEDSITFIRFTQAKALNETALVKFVWAIRKNEDGLAIGSIGLTQTSPTEGRVDYVLDEAHWNKGFLTEAAQKVIAWAFSDLRELEIVRSGGLSENKASLRVMEKCGMREDKRYLCKFKKFNNEEREVTEYFVTREDFQRLDRTS